jgi:hypothetical protein
MNPKIHNDVKPLGDHTLKFSGEQYDSEILDTKVELISEKGEVVNLCWITWGDRELFAQRLNDAISDHRI